MSNDSNGPNKRILFLIDKFRRGEAAPEEINEIDRWYESVTGKGTTGYTDGMSDAEKTQVRDRLLQRVNQRIYHEAEPQPRRILRQGYVFLAAAVLAGVLAIGIRSYLPRQDVPSAAVSMPVDVEPGGNRAVLTLADGRKISLTDARKGELAVQSGFRVTKAADGQLEYEILDDDRGAEANGEGTSGGGTGGSGTVAGNSTVVRYNLIETPNGGQYRVILPDGSKVWLNAASSLRYPVSFSAAKDRHVQLTGEAYFEVAKNENKPFLVTSGEQTVKVLGTHFNVNAYADEPSVKTTLLEGRVEVSLPGNVPPVTLAPGEEAVQQDAGFIVREADIAGAVAWKDGVFMFNSTNLRTLMRQLARWYDVEVRYEGDIAYQRFFGSIERSYALSEVLEVLKLGNVNFRLERPTRGKTRLVVLPSDR